MQILLLSGGSGKRLWPLSNDARSKQFLPLLQKPDGSSESMVQRVVRQICESQLACEITLATNASQEDIILNQLGDKVSCVKEPERRDTFPAIALSCSYLDLYKGCPDDEIVVVMPCDTFTEASYFQSIGKMVEAVENKVADLVLMGVRPTYPSTKYGYIVPLTGETADGTQLVQHFEEKPNLEHAKELLERKAYWNGGVFAFRLGYLKNLIGKYIQVSSFEEVLAHYSDFPKISFDYEVVEKAQSVAVVPFSGKWKDLGTWNTLTEELKDNYVGNVVPGEHNEGTHVINESNLPIFCDGLKNVVVASSPDGIIVCSKERSENIKSYVNQLSKRPMYVERRWGAYCVLNSETYEDNTQYLTKAIRIFAGKYISYQVHQNRKEVWTITKGFGVVVLDDKKREVSAGDVIVVAKGQKHGIKATTDLELLEVQYGENLTEDDIQRFDFAW